MLFWLIQAKTKRTKITKVPQGRREAVKNETEPTLQISVATTEKMEAAQILHIHTCSGHPCVKWIIHFVRRVTPSTSKEEIRICSEYQSIDAEPICWKREKLEVVDVWYRLWMNIIHVSDFLL